MDVKIHLKGLFDGRGYAVIMSNLPNPYRSCPITPTETTVTFLLQTQRMVKDLKASLPLRKILGR